MLIRDRVIFSTATAVLLFNPLIKECCKLKKSLSIALSLLMVLSCVSFLFTGITAYAAQGENHTVSTSVEAQNGLYGGVITTEADQTVAYDDSVTVSAEPYYGNGFLGWYEGSEKVSSDLTYTFIVKGDRTLKAKFEINNMVEDGDFESGTTAGESFFNAEKNSANAGHNVVIENPITGGNHGRYVLKVDTRTANNTNADILTIPFQVKKNTQYVFHLSYYSENIDGTGYVGLHSEKSFSNGWTKSTFVPSYTYHWHPNGSQNTGAWRVDGGVNGSYGIMRKQTHATVNGGKNQWIDFWFTFNPGESDTVFAAGEDTAKMFFLFGVSNTTVNTFYVDNVSITEAKEAPNNAITATATGDGTVTAQDPVLDSVFYANLNGDKSGSATPIVENSTRYSNVLNNTYTAKAATGSSFLGWYDADGNLVSTATTYTFSKNGNYTARFGSGVGNSDGGAVIDNGNNTYTAKAFYGNTFLGWFENEAATTPFSTDDTFDASTGAPAYAKFTAMNQIYDGDFETGAADTADVYNNMPHYGGVTPPTYSVINNPIKKSDESFGDKVLSVLPTQVTTGKPANDKIKNLFNYPVNVEPGKTYIWRFAYTFLANYDSNVHYLNLSIDKGDGLAKPDWDGGLFENYSIHSQTYSYVNDHENDLLDNIWEYEWAWGTGKDKNYTGNKLASGANEWVDNYVIFTAPENVTRVFLTLGTVQSIVCPVLFDNMSFTEVADGNTVTSVTADENGSVLAGLDTAMPAFKATKARGTKPVFTDSIDVTKPLFSSMYLNHYAQADAGYFFDGWYKDGVKISSDKKLTVLSTTGDEYVAKFVYDPNRYYASAEVEADGGAYGGFIDGAKLYNELTSGSIATFKVVTYDGNKFLGWYDGDKLVSEEETLDYVVVKNSELVAKFECNNLVPDAGYENTDASTVVLGAGKEWTSTASDAYGNIVNIAAKDGVNSVNISSAGAEIKHAAVAVEAGKTYHLAFNWMLSRAGADFAIEYIKVFAANGTELATTSAALASSENWQKFFVNFNTGSATSVYFVIKYKGAGSSLYLDNLTILNTEDAPFTIKAEMEMDTIYPGYITSDKIQSANYGEDVTVSVKGYTANFFLGWYIDGVEVSKTETYTFKANQFATLTAKFEINNIIPDSGFENSQAGLSLSDADLWWVNETNKNLFGFDIWYAEAPFQGNNGFNNPGTKFTVNAHDGNKLMRAEHRNNSLGTTFTGLKENTNYVFSFYWQIQNIAPTAYLSTTKLVGTQTKEELGAGRGIGIGATSAEGYQKVMIPFFTGQNTSVDLTISYTAGSGNCYFDDFTLYESDYITLIEGEGGSIDTTFNGGVSGPALRGEEITLKAVADAGYEFMGWYDYTDPTIIFGTNTTYTFKANGAVSIAAFFRPIGDTDYDPFNYFIDGDFENNSMSAPIFDTTATWVSYGVIPSFGDILPYSGDNFLRLSSPSQATSFHITNLEPYTTYTVSLAYNVPTGVNFESVSVFARHKEWERVEEKDPAGVFKPNKMRTASTSDRVSPACLGYISIGERGTEGEWRTLEFTFTTKNRTEAYFKPGYGRPSNAFSNDLFLDNIQIKKTSSGYSDRLADGDFETTSADGWQGALTTATDGSNKVATLQNGANIFQNVILKRYTDYTVSFKARSATGGSLTYGMTRGGRDLFKADGTIDAFTNTTWGEAQLTADWKEYSFDITTPDLLHYALHFIGNDSAVEIDDVKIEKATSVKEFDKVTFEAIEGNYITNASIQDAGATYNNGSGMWQAKYALNNKVYSLYTAAAEGDAMVHSGLGSLIMKGFTEQEAASTFTEDELNYYKATGAPLVQNFADWNMQPGKTYEISYWVKAEKAGTKFTSMIVETDAKWYLDDICHDEITVGTEWQKVTQKFVVGESVNTSGGAIRFCVNRINPNNDSDIYFDDIVINQTASTVLNTNETNLYTQDISQNYLENYSFEKAEGKLGAFSKAASDAVYGSKIGSFKAGDKVVIPVNTRTDYKQTFSETYTLAASIRGNASAQGGIYVTIDAAGNDVLASFETDEAVVISPNTNGAWKRSGFTFADERFTTLYLVIECTAGAFDVDYLEFFNSDYGYKNVQYDEEEITFDPNGDKVIDANAGAKGNYIAGTITGLPSGSKLVLKGAKNYSAEIADDGSYEINDIANGTYNMYVAASDAEFMTLWGDITFEDTVLSGLACERLNGNAINVTGMGVRNGIVKIVDYIDDGAYEWAYLTAINEVGEYSAYILDCNWYIEGTTNESEALGTVTIEQFKSGAATLEVAAVETDMNGTNATPIVCIAIMMVAAAALVLTRKKGVSM